MTQRRALGWLGLVALLELTTRAIVYALAPAPLAVARGLGHHLGGPRFALVLVVALGLAALLAGGIVWLATLGVRERWELAAARPAGPRPSIALRTVLLRAIGLTLAGWLCFAGVESYLHVRAGLGFHGLDCLVGPVHRNALPVVAALAIVASALASAAGLLVAWMRRTVARFGRPRIGPRAAATITALVGAGRAAAAPPLSGPLARGPPGFVA